MGQTITNGRTFRQAVLKVRDHRVLREHFSRLRQANPQYVLLSHDHMKGPGGRRISFKRALTDALEHTRQRCIAAFQHWIDEIDLPLTDIQHLDSKNCWYGYWEGHLKKVFVRHGIGNALDSYADASRLPR